MGRFLFFLDNENHKNYNEFTNNYIPGLPRAWHGGVRRGMITSRREFL
jgi:hypothetical protein